MNTTMLIMAEANGVGGGKFIIMMVVIFAIMWFFMIRPQQKKQKELQNFRNSIEVGTEVVTAGGIHGKVREIVEEDNTLIVEIARDVKIKIDRNSVYAQSPATNGK